ncbi:MAG: TetR/AcrR family transcriptional regulator [Psychrilyobacter sp.]|uniref:TetR/AcrR family transcriptional regulator n=1 Tax=Psychrilyobacter sp. TaxID=2586924 RepID=UPI003C795C4E
MPSNKKQDKKELIVLAAIELLRTKNYQGMKTLEIAKKANMAEGTLYRYFKNKDAIFASIVKHFLDSFLEKAFKNIEPENEFQDNLKLLIDNICDVLETGKDFYKLYLKAFSEIEKEEVCEIIKVHTIKLTKALGKILEWTNYKYTDAEKLIFVDCIWGVIKASSERDILNIEKINKEKILFSISYIGKMIQKL